MEDLLKEKDTDAVRYAAAVMNHMTGNMNRAAELYKSLPYDRRAQKNLQELKNNNPVPPVPLLSEDIFLAYDSVSWKKFFIDFFEDIEYVILFAKIIFILITVALLSSIPLFLGFIFIPAKNKKSSTPSMNKPLAWFSRLCFFLAPGTFDIRRGSPLRGWLVIILFTFAISSICGFLFYGYSNYSPDMVSAFSSQISYLVYDFPFPHSLSNENLLFQVLSTRIFDFCKNQYLNLLPFCIIVYIEIEIILAPGKRKWSEK